jgi:hypothetical protein
VGRYHREMPFKPGRMFNVASTKLAKSRKEMRGGIGFGVGARVGGVYVAEITF